jgi:hypothetical protein
MPFIASVPIVPDKPKKTKIKKEMPMNKTRFTVLVGMILAAAAIPFFRNTLLSDLFCSALLFGVLALAEKRWPILAEAALAASRP